MTKNQLQRQVLGLDHSCVVLSRLTLSVPQFPHLWSGAHCLLYHMAPGRRWLHSCTVLTAASLLVRAVCLVNTRDILFLHLPGKVQRLEAGDALSQIWNPVCSAQCVPGTPRGCCVEPRCFLWGCTRLSTVTRDTEGDRRSPWEAHSIVCVINEGSSLSHLGQLPLTSSLGLVGKKKSQ